MTQPTRERTITNALIERGAAALWRDRGISRQSFDDAAEYEASWSNTCADVELVLRAVLEGES